MDALVGVDVLRRSETTERPHSPLLEPGLDFTHPCRAVVRRDRVSILDVYRRGVQNVLLAPHQP
jgi:hypothetical protein